MRCDAIGLRSDENENIILNVQIQAMEQINNFLLIIGNLFVFSRSSLHWLPNFGMCALYRLVMDDGDGDGEIAFSYDFDENLQCHYVNKCNQFKWRRSKSLQLLKMGSKQERKEKQKRKISSI